MRRVSKYEHKSYGPDREKKILTLRENLTNFLPIYTFSISGELEKNMLSLFMMPKRRLAKLRNEHTGRF